jgi:hypothetical protein
MSQDIPVASHLLASKMFGVSVRKLAESMGPPLIVPLILYTIGLPLLVTIPLVFVGFLVGLFIYSRTPAGQRPLQYAGAMARHLRGRTDYVWKPPKPNTDDLAYHEPFEAWITGPPKPVVADEDAVSDDGEGTGAETETDEPTDSDDGPDADWPIATYGGQTND